MTANDLDITRKGSRGYHDDEAFRVVRYMTTHIAVGEWIRTADLAAATNVDGRTCRAILSDRDGVDFLLALGDDGVAIAEWADDADEGTNRLVAQANALRLRAERRDAYAKRLPRRQPGLF